MPFDSGRKRGSWTVMAARPLVFDPPTTAFSRVDILEHVYQKLLNGPKLSRTLVYGFPVGYGALEFPVVVTVIRYQDEDSLEAAARVLPYGMTLIGIVEYDVDEAQEVYAPLDQFDQPILLKVAVEDKIVCSTGLDYLTSVELNVISGQEFWNKDIVTFRLRGEMFVSTLLEPADLKTCFGEAKKTVEEQVAYTLGKDRRLLIPPEGKFVTESEKEKASQNTTVEEMMKVLKVESTDKSSYTPSASMFEVKISFDLSKCKTHRNPLMVVFGKVAVCKQFEHYLGVDVMVAIPKGTPFHELYRHFNEALCTQLELGFHSCITRQLVNSISAEKPEVFHFWPSFAEHFVSVVYPQNTCLEKLKDIRLQLHGLFCIREPRPHFRQSAALFQSLTGLASPHMSLKGKFSENEFIRGNYEYRHYMQEGFNDDGWGCAYRSLQSIVSWFRLQGFTSRSVPTHQEIQECLVSLGDKPQSFVGSKQWIGSTEVSFVLEALLGVSCRIMALNNGGEMASRASELHSRFRIHGTPIMVGGGVLAHTIIGVSSEPDSDSDVNFLILDPHYTGKDDLKTILSKGWVGWKDSNFWSKKDFYNLCMPLLPASI